ncbi:hypothetical protein HET73_03975 [Wolbachia endosymbiont of Atemnus politus]|uniref:hypothetical protein n=1 Tax=Wolbachia endosymbiont of Atemnus politus TaxID=2682840 RepID=UPI0015737F9C|nr:hypothetical protein [Wolbachia endosymbiont of Atemnus politus]NSM56614.1 hypothetical protein [Wolbachia endosymbiont of Atemnus politus]
MQVPKEDKNVDYLEEVREFINANSIKESIYESSRKDESLYATINKNTFSLQKEMETIKSVLINNGHKLKKEVHNVQDLFKEEVIRTLKEQGYGASSKERKEIIVKRSKPIDIQKVQEIIKDASDRAIEGFKVLKIVPEESTYRNLQDIQNALKVQAGPVHQSSFPRKRKSSDGMGVDNKKQDIKDIPSSETQAKPTHSKRHAMMLDTQQVESILQEAKEQPLVKKYAYTQHLSLLREIHTFELFFQDRETMKAVSNLFMKEVVTKLKEQGYAVSSEQGDNEITVSSNELIYASKINKDVIIKSLEQVMENKEKIQGLEKLHKGNQLEREISKLLNADVQKENIHSNSVSKKPLAPPSPTKKRNQIVIYQLMTRIKNQHTLRLSP